MERLSKLAISTTLSVKFSNNHRSNLYRKSNEEMSGREEKNFVATAKTRNVNSRAHRSGRKVFAKVEVIKKIKREHTKSTTK